MNDFPKKLSELYPSLASTNGLKAASVEITKRLDPNSPLSEMLSLALIQSVDMFGKLEKAIEENGIEEGTIRIPTLPEEKTIMRIEEVKKGFRSLEEFLNGEQYQPHPRLSNTFRLETSQPNIYPAFQVSFKNLDLPNSNFIEPEWYGLTFPELKRVFSQTENISHAQQSAEKRYGQNETRLDEVTSSWEEASPGTIKIAWGRVSENSFVPCDTHLEIDIIYSRDHGYVGLPKLVLTTAETKQKGITVFAEGEPFPLTSFSGIPSQNMNRAIAQALKI